MLDSWITEEVLAVDAVVKQRHVGRDPSCLILVEHRSEMDINIAFQSRELGEMSQPEKGDVDIPVLMTRWTLDITAL